MCSGVESVVESEFDEPGVSSVDVNMDAREGRGEGRVDGPG